MNCDGVWLWPVLCVENVGMTGLQVNNYEGRRNTYPCFEIRFEHNILRYRSRDIYFSKLHTWLDRLFLRKMMVEAQADNLGQRKEYMILLGYGTRFYIIRTNSQSHTFNIIPVIWLWNTKMHFGYKMASIAIFIKDSLYTMKYEICRSGLKPY